METRYVRTGDEIYLRMAKFWGRLFIINFALGVVTGITLEFQFGMNWAEYSRYVGDIFGVPLAIEAIAAFSLESVFIELWALALSSRTPSAGRPLHNPDFSGVAKGAPGTRPSPLFPRPTPRSSASSISPCSSSCSG